MIFKSLIFACTILCFWPRGARCESDASLEMGETNLADSSVPGFVSLHKRYTNNDDIDHVKPVLNNVDVSARDYQIFRMEPHRWPPQRFDSVGSNVNVNVNHRDSLKPRRNVKQSKRLNRRRNSKQRDDDGNRMNHILEIMRMMPNTNVDYNLAHPHGDMLIRKRKYIASKLLRNTTGDGNDGAVSNDEGNNQCHPIVYKALEYLRRVEIDLRNLDKDLRSLISGPRDMDFYQVTT